MAWAPRYGSTARAVALALVLSCTAVSAPIAAEPEERGLSSWFDPRTSPFIPIPEVGTDPNSGTTLGLLGVYLKTDEQRSIRRIFAPDIIYNPQLGWGSRFRVFGYPSKDTEWYAVAGAKQRIEREVDLSYATGLTRQEPVSAAVRLVHDRSATERFFGFGNATGRGTETNYTREQSYAELRAGWNLGPSFQIGFVMRPRLFQVEHGSFGSVPSIEDRFAGIAGLGSEHELLNRIIVSYDTRDSADVPTAGTLLTGFAGRADRAFLSSVSYSAFGADLRHYAPAGERRTVAAHAALQYTAAEESTPFWAIAALGGDRSLAGERQPLRGFGADRFTDRNMFAAGIELRNRVVDLELFSTQVAFEVAPFVETGRVFRNLDDNPLARLHWTGGLGLRVIAEPFVVGYLDAGYGGEGLAIFSGINYPF
jgi:hypothetical protein